MSSDQSEPFTRVLAFHKSIPHFSFGSTNFSPVRLEQLLKQLRSRNIRFVPATFRPDRTARDLSVALTFDDGYAHLAEVLPRLIDLFAIRPLIFIPTGWIGQTNRWDYSHYFRKDLHLDRPAIRMLAERGAEFGSHSHLHLDLTGLSQRRLEMELRQSKEILEDAIRKPVKTISYPFGRSTELVRDAARRCGFEYGFTMRFPTPGDSSLSIGRIPVYGYDTPLSIAAKLSSGGLFFQTERLKCRVTNSLSGGTVLLNRLRRSH